MKRVLIDSDVIIDFLVKRQPFDLDSVRILTKCQKGDLEAFITAISIVNIHYVVSKVNGKGDSVFKISQLLQFLDVAVTGKETVLRALISNFPDFEDALQNFSGENVKNLSAIITRNIRDYRTSNLQIVSPSEFLNLTS